MYHKIHEYAQHRSGLSTIFKSLLLKIVLVKQSYSIVNMKKQLMLLSLLLGITMSISAQAGKWTSLFDGKTLKGWTQKGGNATYTIGNNEIIGTTAANTPNTFLCSDKMYDNFVLELELSLEGTMNSGVQFRSNLKTNKDGKEVVYGPQAEVDPSARAWSGGIYDEQRRQWLYNLNINPEGQKAFKPNAAWNKYRIEAIDGNIRTWINDIPTANLVDTLVEKGFIALQVHSIGNDQSLLGKKVRWRNIRIQTGADIVAKPSNNCPVINLKPNSLSEAEKKLGWRLLFNGQNLDGWRSAFKTTAPEAGWGVNNGVLFIQGSDGSESRSFGDIVSKEEFKAFELTFDFKLTPGANSGVKYFVSEKFDSKGGSAIGLEYQLLDDEKHPDAKMGAAGNRTLASLYDLIPSYKLDARFHRKVGEWCQARIVVMPNNIVQHWLNGFKVLEYERKSNIFAALVARSKYNGFEGFGTNDQGHILLQDHGNTVYYRSIKIRTL